MIGIGKVDMALKSHKKLEEKEKLEVVMVLKFHASFSIGVRNSIHILTI